MEPMYLSIQPEKTGERIRKLLLEQGYTIREIQGAFGFENPQAIYKWLSGKSLPSIDNFIILSRLLHTTIEDILVIDGDIPHLWGILNRWLNDICHRMIYNRIRSKCRKMRIERKAKIMQKITSAYANKMLRSLEEDKAFWVNKEASSSTYVAAVNEEPVIPEYNYMTVAHTIDEIDRKIIIIKHALNLTNATAKVQIGEQEMSIDSILVRMAQLNKRKAVLDDMRKRLPKTRVYGSAFSSSGSAPEYKYINYDPELIRQEYDRISNMIMDMQIALDRYNQTVLFEVDI